MSFFFSWPCYCNEATNIQSKHKKLMDNVSKNKLVPELSTNVS